VFVRTVDPRLDDRDGVTIICLVRASSHLVSLVGCLVMLIAMGPPRARQIACCALLTLVIVTIIGRPTHRSGLPSRDIPPLDR